MGDLLKLRSHCFVTLISLLWLTASCQSGDNQQPISKAIDAFTQVQNVLCDKQVVLLGEGPNHGEGATEAFKSNLVQSLIENCGFELLVFESAFYEFAKIDYDRSQDRQIERDAIAAAMGGLWRYDAQVQPLISYITEAVNAGTLTVGGMDDQVAGHGQDYANFELPKHVMKGRGDECLDIMSRKAAYTFTKEDPYDAAKKSRLIQCLVQTNRPDESPFDPEMAGAMRATLARMVERDFVDNYTQSQGRELSMFENFSFWYERKKQPKTIIWTATVHAAKSGSFWSRSENFETVGQKVNESFGEASYVLGFSALMGRHRLMNGKFETLPDAPKTSLEAMSIQSSETDIVFLNTPELVDLGRAPSAALSNRYQEQNWDTFLDGLVIFREQTPVTRINQSALTPP